MRYVSIDLSSDNYLQQPKIFGGYAGEHNETVLQVKLPLRMVDIECSGYRFDFQTSEDNKISIFVSELNDGVLSLHLTEQLTLAGELLFNVAAILSDENSVSLISKTNTVTLYIGDSPEGNNVLLDPNGYKDELLEMIDERIDQLGSGKSAYEIALQEGFEGTEEEWLESLQGTSGVYVGSGDMPEDCNVQIDPDGEVFTIDQTYNPESPNAQSGKAVAQAVANFGGGSGDFEQIGDIILTEPVNEVVFSEFETPLKDYKQIFMVSAFGVDVDASGAFKIRSADGGLYFMWSGLGAISANTNYGFWHSIEQMGVDDYPIYKSTYSSQRLNNMGSDIGNLITQGLADNNVTVKSDYTHHKAIIEEYRFGVPSNVKFIAGSRFILFGRK